MPDRALRPRYQDVFICVHSRSSESKNARQGIKTIEALDHNVVDAGCQNQKMPDRALRLTGYNQVAEPLGWVGQNQKMPDRALRRNRPLLHRPTPIERQNQKMPDRALRPFFLFSNNTLNNSVRIKKCPTGH